MNSSASRFHKSTRLYLGLGTKAIKILSSRGFGGLWQAYKQYREDRRHHRALPKRITDSKSQVPIDETVLVSSLEDSMEVRLACFLNGPGHKLVFPQYAEPVVTIITPVFNKASYTFQYLESLLAHTRVPYELIIINNCSTDETNQLLGRTTNVICVTNEDNLGFIRACNQGANMAKGKHLLFANNDISVTPGWLSTLVRTAESDNKCGAVGCKLVLPNGTLQEAGSIIWQDGTATGYGRGDAPLNPSYSYLREVDYCSAACLLVRKTLFHQLNGFDEIYLPAYYEDADLCLGICTLGYKVIYQPEVTVFHHEYASGGYQNASSLMQTNSLKFLSKWENTLKDKLAFSPSNILHARDSSRRKRILVLDDRIPTPDQGSGYPRAYQIIKSIAGFGYGITLFPLVNTEAWQPYTHEFQQLGVEVFYGNNLDLGEFAKERAGYYDLILVSRPHNMERAHGIIERFFPGAALLYDAEAIFAVREMLKAKVRGDRQKERAAEHMITEEIDLLRRADVIIAVSENEKRIILDRAGLKNVTVWGHPVQVREPQTTYDQRKDLLFVGAFFSPDSPNENAIIYFAEEVFPEVEAELSCRLLIAGVNPPDSVRKLSSASVTVTGYVEDLREYYEKCRIFVVPHRYSAGIALKLLEAMAHGIPAVVSGLTAAQLDLTDGKQVVVAETSEEFAQKVIRLYQDTKLWHTIQHNALTFIRQTCAPENMRDALNEIILQGLQTKGGN